MIIPIYDAADILTGYQAREGLQADPSGTHFAIQAKDIDQENGHRLISENIDRIFPVRDPSPYTLKSGDVLFLSKGRRRFATLVEGLPDTPEAIALYYFFILRPKTGVVDPAFLAWIINQTEAQEFLNREADGTTIPSLTKQSFLKLRISVPPLAKQLEISNLNRLSHRERSLLRKLEHQRADYTNALCLALWTESKE